MYEIIVESHIDAAHYLREYNGKCENLHGHRYKIVVHVTAEKLNKIGLAYDFTDLKKHLNAICDRYDHTCLNDTPPFDKINASSENLASTIYQELKKKVAKDPAYAKASADRPAKSTTNQPVKITAVEVWETPFQGVTYRE